MPINIDKIQIENFNSLELLAKQVVEGFITGLHKSPYHGFSVEFAEHMLYNTGESVKNIDWKLYGRTDRLYIKRFEEETNLRCQIVIDSSSSMFFPFNKNNSVNSKIYFAINAAAALAYLLRTQRDAVGLTIFTDKIITNTKSLVNLTHQKFIFNELEKIINPPFYSTGKLTNNAECLHFIAENIHKRSLVIIFSDLFDDNYKQLLLPALQHLKHNKHEVILFHVIDEKHEINFEFNNMPIKFVDLETNEELKIRPNEINNSYKKQINIFLNDLSEKCASYNIDYIKADINKGFHNVLLSYLLKREKMI